MTKKRKIALCVFAILLVVSVTFSIFFSYQKKKAETIINLSTEEKLEDFDELCGILDECYPFWEEAKQLGIEKEALYSEYRTNIEKADTDIAFFKEIRYFLKEFDGLGHLDVLDGQMYQLYVDTLVESDGMLSEEEARAIRPLMAVLTDENVKETYALLDKSHGGFRSMVGLKEEYQKAEADENTAESTGLETGMLKGQTVAYVKNSDFQLIHMEKDKQVLADFWKTAENTENLIIDIRGNSGGSDKYWEELLVKPNAKEALVSERQFYFQMNDWTKEYVQAGGIEARESLEEANDFSHYTIDWQQFEPAKNPYKGKIWVLVDEDVYSASENFAMFCKKTGFAALVGTPTGGDGGMADPILIPLSNSGLVVRFSMFYGLNADGSGNEAAGTMPDVLISEEADALEKCLELIG